MKITYRAIGKSGKEIKNKKDAVHFIATATVVVNDVAIDLKKQVESESIDVTEEFKKELEKQTAKKEGVYVTDVLSNEFLNRDFSFFKGMGLIIPSSKLVKSVKTDTLYSRIYLDDDSVILAIKYTHNYNSFLSIREYVKCEKAISNVLKKYDDIADNNHILSLRNGILKYSILIKL